MQVRLDAVPNLYGYKQSLMAALTDEDRQVRMLAAIALGERRDSRAVGPLVGVLEQEIELNLSSNWSKLPTWEWRRPRPWAKSRIPAPPRH